MIKSYKYRGLKWHIIKIINHFRAINTDTVYMSVADENYEEVIEILKELDFVVTEDVKDIPYKSCLIGFRLFNN